MSYPMFWTWMGYAPGMDFEAACTLMRDTGIDGVQLNAGTADEYRAAVAIAKKYGIEVYAWVVTMNQEGGRGRDELLRDHPDWFCVNRLGQSLVDTKAYVDYYKFLCPAIPEAREFILNRVRSFCQVEGLGGISVDYHRFPDVILPTTLWPNYNCVQDHEYPEWDYGYHPEMIRLFKQKHGYDPREWEDPSKDEAWLDFRCEKITEVANAIAAVAHGAGKKMSGSPFPTPKMSRKMVRQDWGKWNMDIVFPMVYHHFYTEDTSFIADCTIENLRDKNPMTTLFIGLMMRDTPEITGYMDAALQNGAEGISIFTLDGLKSSETRAAFRAYADRMRGLRERGELPVANPPKQAVTDPFAKEGVMRLIHGKMRALSGGDLTLGSWTQVDEWEAAKRYHVTDAVSGKTFDVRFFFYGGILSGWIVQLV